MASRKKEDLHLILQNAFDKAIVKYSELYPNASKPFLTCTYRSNEEQEQLYAQGRTASGKVVTMARKYESPHNYLPSLAFDIAFINKDKKLDWDTKLFKNFYDIVSENELVVWGGNFKSIKDFPHFELKNWKEYAKMF